MKCDIYKPSLEAAELIKCIWSLEHERSSIQRCVERLVPTGCVELLFHYGDHLLFRDRNGEIPSDYYGMISGQKTRFTDVQTAGKVGFISVMLWPDCAGSILGIKIDELKNLSLRADDVFGKEGKQLCEKIINRNNNVERIGDIESFLLERFKKSRLPVDKRIRECVKLITQSGGDIRVDSLAEKVNISKRQLERIFISLVGASPKEFSNIIRFQYALALQSAGRLNSLTDLAYEGGFADQAHFISNFKKMTGYTPGRYFQKYPAYSDFYQTG